MKTRKNIFTQLSFIKIKQWIIFLMLSLPILILENLQIVKFSKFRTMLDYDYKLYLYEVNTDIILHNHR